jgi:hypothetical protein
MLHASRTGFQGFCVSSLRFLVLNLPTSVRRPSIYTSRGYVGDILASFDMG